MYRSSGFGEPNNVSVFSETFSTEEEVVFSDKTHLAFAVSAFSAVFSVVSDMSSPEQVWHCYVW